MLGVRTTPFAIFLYHQLSFRSFPVFTGEIVDALAFATLQSDQIFTEF
jgi:hypothetical protein